MISSSEMLARFSKYNLLGGGGGGKMVCFITDRAVVLMAYT